MLAAFGHEDARPVAAIQCYLVLTINFCDVVEIMRLRDAYYRLKRTCKCDLSAGGDRVAKVDA